MKLGAKILLSFLIIFGLALYYITHDFLSGIRFRYLEGVEDSLVDQSRILASLLSIEMDKNKFPETKFEKIFNHTYQNTFSTKIYELNKTHVDMRVYVTDNKGILIFDSQKKDKPGTDYFNWRDVYLTLKGEYGARSTKEDPLNPNSSILYVAAPVIVKGQIMGVLTVAKPTNNINNFLHTARMKIKVRSIIAGFFVVLFCVMITVMLTRPIIRLTQYANTIRDGEKADLPKMDRSEIGDMGRAFENMRQALEGKKYVETYVQTLTHEIKSPISAIKGAAELLEEDMNADQRATFLSNIRGETKRIEDLVNRMLALSSLEGMNVITRKDKVRFNALVETVLEEMKTVCKSKNIKLIKHFKSEISITGDTFLLKQAISNLLQNAVDFSPENGEVKISVYIEKDRLVFMVEDEGPGIADFAKQKVFEKFFSMRRPDTGQKSTGLGLNFVKEIAELHNGDIELENTSLHGTKSILTIHV